MSMIKIILLVLAVLAAAALAVVIRDIRFPVVREYCFTSPKLKGESRFVLISDLHGCSYGRKNERLVRMVLKQRPDALLGTGDFVTAHSRTGSRAALELIEGVTKAGVPVYYALGNHEQKLLRVRDRGGPDRISAYMSALEEMGVTLLRNKRLALPEKGLLLHGLELPFPLYHKKLKRGTRALKVLPVKKLKNMLGKPDPESFNLLLAHDPEFFFSYDAWGAELTLSGHNHGGVVRVPFLGGLLSPALELFPRFDGGEYRGEKGSMVISRGTGMHTLPIRFFNPAEVVVIRLKGEG